MSDTNDSSLKTKRSQLSIHRPMRLCLALFVGAYAVWAAPTAYRWINIARLESIGAKIEFEEQPCSLLQKYTFGVNATSRVEAIGLHPDQPLTDDQLALLAKFPEVTHIYLEGEHITDDVMEYVAQLPNLESLGVSTGVTDHGYAQLVKADSLKTLLLCHVTVNDDMLKSFGMLSSLRDLGFMESRFHSADFGHLAGLPQLNKIAIMDSSFEEEVRNLSKLHTLEGLYLINAPFTDDDCANLSDLPRLKELRIHGTQISDAGIRHFANLQSLEHLHLKGESITDDGLAHVAGLHRLKHLDLSSTKIGDEGLAHLNELSHLEHLDLSDTEVSDAGLTHLNGLSHLEYLDLWGTDVSNTGLKQIASMPSLGWVSLHDTKVTADGLAIFTESDLGPSESAVRIELAELFPSSDEAN
ncbi:MAG: hypothetical protein R3C01_01110 [Planctomycetaceae bacterium]